MVTTTPKPPQKTETPNPNLTKFIYISLATSFVVVVTKALAAYLTGSVGLWSDALESTANLAAALIALWALKLAEKPADDNHHYGHGKAEYFSSAVEGAMILVAAVLIIYSAIQRLIHPVELGQIGIGLALTIFASIANLAVGIMLIRAGKKYRSITLTADGKHLLTDVWTSIGIILAIGLVPLTGWLFLDPLIAIIVAINICYSGYSLIRESGVGLLDAAMPPEEIQEISSFLRTLQKENEITVLQLLTRVSGRQRFAEVIIQVPGDWTIKKGHEYCDLVEDEIARILPGTVTLVHLEPHGSTVSSARPDPDFRFNKENIES